MKTIEERFADVDTELDNWIDDANVIARERVDEFGTTVAVVDDEDGYRVLRAFALGDGADVSVDFQARNLEQVVSHLLTHYKL